MVKDYQVYHLSTHGVYDHRNPEFSYIAFQKQLGNGNEGQLFVNEIESMELPADMVVISACQSALGEFQRGEGLLSMAQSISARW